MASRICYLRSARDFTKRILLPHETPVIIGRNEDTGITDVHVSRQHLELVADHDAKKVMLKTLGKCYSGCNGYALIHNETYTLKDGDRIEVRLGFHEYDVVFEEEPEPLLKKVKTDVFDMFTSKNEGSSKEFKDGGKWEDVDGKELLIYSHEKCKSQKNIAAFDMDGTIIKTKSGARFPKDSGDWVINFDNIPKKLQELCENDYKIVIFTNQSGLGNDMSKVKGFKGKIENIVAYLKVPAQVYIATGKSIYRKPAPGMWNYLQDFKNDKLPIDTDKCFYVGDAAGRQKDWAHKKKKDHSIADRLFAINIGITFYTPEEYFLKSSSVPHTMPEFDPSNIPTSDYPVISLSKPEVILMVGCQGSGKSFYCKKHLVPKGFIHVSTDKLGSWQKCVKMLEECLQKNQSVVIDNTNPDKESRQRFIKTAKTYGVVCRCFVMDITHKHSMHNNRFRQMTDKAHTEISDMILNSYKKKFEDPELVEGFAEIVKIPFIPTFEKEEHKKLYKMFLLES